MIALDTNVVVRLLVRDDEAEARLAAEVVRRHPIWLSKTVLLELVWVLTYTYGYERADVVLALSRLLGLPNVRVDDAAVIMAAIGHYQQGIDFADALHLGSSGGAAEMVTFDQKFATRAVKLGLEPPVRLLA